MSYLVVFGALGALAWLGLWIAVRVVHTASAFLAELRQARLVEQPREVRAAATFRDAESLLLAAQDGFRSVLRQSWRELIGWEDPALRQRTLVTAWGDLLNAQRAMRALHAQHPLLQLDPGPDVPLVDDPMHALAVRRSWVVWGGLMLLPWVFRALYTFVVLRVRVAPMLERARGLDDQLVAARRFSDATHSAARLPSARERAGLVAA